jgi:hypothetical protein
VPQCNTVSPTGIFASSLPLRRAYWLKHSKNISLRKKNYREKKSWRDVTILLQQFANNSFKKKYSNDTIENISVCTNPTHVLQIWVHRSAFFFTFFFILVLVSSTYNSAGGSTAVKGCGLVLSPSPPLIRSDKICP